MAFLFFSAIFRLFGLGSSEAYAQKVYQRMEIDQMNQRLKPYVIRLPEPIYQMAGINIPNTFAVLNNRLEIALVTFDKEMKASFKVPAPGFPGKDGFLRTDSESHFAWLRRGSGNYFLDIQTGENGHCVSMFVGSDVRQVILADPDEKIWFILYAQMGMSMVDKYELKENKKITTEGGISGNLFPFTNNRILAYTDGFVQGIYDWRFTDIDFSYPPPPENNELTKKMTKMGIELDYERKMYNLKNRIMLGDYQAPTGLITVSIRWNKDEDEVKIEPFTPLHHPIDIAGFFALNEFSSDGKWFDAYAKHKFNGIGQPTERFVYNVGDQYPAGISPPIRLGLADLNDPGAFLLHDTWGPCYVMLDMEHKDHILVYKLSEGMEIIAEQLRSYIPPTED